MNTNKFININFYYRLTQIWSLDGTGKLLLSSTKTKMDWFDYKNFCNCQTRLDIKWLSGNYPLLTIIGEIINIYVQKQMKIWLSFNVFFQRPLLKEMKKMGERNIVLDCSQIGLVAELLNQAQQVAMTTFAQSYLITSLVGTQKIT